MLTISLRFALLDDNGSDGDHRVPDHPIFVDYEYSESRKCSSLPEVSVDFNNALGPLLVGLVGKSAIESIAELNDAKGFLPAEREDGHRIADLLLAWAKQWPNARWDISGNLPEIEILRSRTRTGHLKMSAEAPRYGSNTVDWSEAQEVGLGDPMTDPDDVPRARGCGGTDPYCQLPCCNVVRDSTLQRQGLKLTGGGGSSGKAHREPKKLSIADRNRKTDARLADDGFSRTEHIQGRVSKPVQSALKEQGISIGEMMEIVGTAILEAGSFHEVKHRMMRKKRGPKAA